MPTIAANAITLMLIVANLADVGSFSLRLAMAAVAAVLLFMRGPAPLAVAFSLFGTPFLQYLEGKWAISITVCMAGMAPLLLLLLLCTAVGKLAQVARLARFVLFAAACYAVFAISMLGAEGSAYAAYWWKWILVYGVVHILTGMVILTSETSVSEILLPSLMFASFLLPAMDMSILELPRLASETSWGLRGNSEFDAIESARVFGLLLVAGAVSWTRSRKRTLDGLLPALVAVTAVPVVIYSYTRQVLLACVLAMLLLGYGQTMGSLRNLLRHSMRLTVFAGILAIVAMFVITDAMLEGSRLTTEGLTGTDRFEQWLAAWNMILESPLWGRGVGAFAASGQNVWVHNWFLEAWLEHGLPLLLLFLFGTWRMARGWLRPRELPESLAGWSVLSFYYFIVVQFSGDIARNSLMFLFLCLAIAVIPEKRPTPEGQVPPPVRRRDRVTRKPVPGSREESQPWAKPGAYSS